MIGSQQRRQSEQFVQRKGVAEEAPGTGPKTFYPDPGSIWIADNSCGQAGCHQGYPYRMERSLMNTEAGKIQGTREAKVKVRDDIEYSGIPVETCNSCHNRGKRIGVTYQGLMEFPYGSPYAENGSTQPKLHTKQYLFISDDLHHQHNQSRPENPMGGMLCQDCHTTIDMHGDGNIFGTTLAQVEIECQDCHGTPATAPWDLPLGYSEEFAKEIATEPRGLGDALLAETRAYATQHDKKEGYLLSARGNPLGNVVKDGDKVIMHSANGFDFEVPILKKLADAAVFDMSARFNARHKQALVVAMHKNQLADAYSIFLFNDYEQAKQLINEHLDSLSFLP